MVKITQYITVLFEGLQRSDRNTRIKRYRFFGGVAVLVASVGVYLLQVFALRVGAQNLEAVQQALGHQRAVLAETLPTTVVADAAWVTPDLLTWVLGQVVQMADLVGVSVEDATFGEKIAVDRLQGYPLYVVVQGDFAALLDFVKTLGKFEKLVGLQSLEWMTEWRGQRKPSKLYLEAKLVFVGLADHTASKAMPMSRVTRAPRFKYRGFMVKAEQHWGILEKEGRECVLVKVNDRIDDWTVLDLDTEHITLALTQSKNLNFRLKFESQN